MEIIHPHCPFNFGAELVSVVSKVRGTPLLLIYHNDLIREGFHRFLFGAFSTHADGMVLGGARKLVVLSEESGYLKCTCIGGRENLCGELAL